MARNNNDPVIGIGGGPTRVSTLPTDPKERKEYPLFTGLFEYFPDALAMVSHISYIGGKQHHPDKPLHWDRSKSTDEKDTLLRHLAQSGTYDIDGVLHDAKVAWRALSMLQRAIEEEHNIIKSNHDDSRETDCRQAANRHP